MTGWLWLAAANHGKPGSILESFRASPIEDPYPGLAGGFAALDPGHPLLRSTPATLGHAYTSHFFTSFSAEVCKNHALWYASFSPPGSNATVID